MWLTFLIAGVVFVGMMAALFFGYQEVEKERNGKPAPVTAAEPPPMNPWLKPNNPWVKQRTVEQVVVELESRIDAEMQEVARLLGRSTIDGVARIYRA